MSTRTEYQDRSSRELEREIDSTRSEMDETIDKLGDKLSPRNLLDSFLDAVRGDGSSSPGKDLTHSLKSAGDSIKQTVAQHPVPAMLTAAGALWWLFDSACDDEHTSRQPTDAAAGEDDAIPTWHDSYQWDRSATDSEQHWSRRADKIFADLQSRSQDSSLAPTDQLRHAAAKSFALSGYRRSDIAGRRHLCSSGTQWEQLHNLDRIASDYEESDDPSITEKASETWENVKTALADTKRSTKDRLRDISESIGDYARSTSSTVKGWGSSSAERVSDWTSAAKGRSASAMSYTRRQASQAGSQVSRGAGAAKSAVVDASSEYPLAAAAACYGVGLALGLLLPRSRYEDELLGETSDVVKEEVQAAAGDALERGKEVAAKTADAALDEAERRGVSPESVGRNAQAAISKASEAVKESATQAKAAAGTVAETAGSVAKKSAETAKQETKRQSKNA